MDEQELIQKLRSLRGIEPDPAWLKKSEKELLSQMPKAQWPVYPIVAVLVFALSMGLVLFESPQRAVKLIQQVQDQNKESHQEEVENKVAMTDIKDVVARVKKASNTAKKIERHIEERIVMASKVGSSSDKAADPLIKLKEDLAKIKATRELLEEIEQDIKNGDYVIARKKLDKFLKDGDNNDNTEESTSHFNNTKWEVKVEGSKELDNN
jgi:hypothetical protein